MVRKDAPRQGLMARNIEEMIRRTPAPLLSQHNRKHFNIYESSSMGHLTVSSSTKPVKTSKGNLDQFGFSSAPLGDPASHGGSSFRLQGLVPQEGATMRYLYLPLLLSFVPKTSTSSPYEEGTHKDSESTSVHLGPSRGGSKSGGSNSRTRDFHLPYQLSSLYPVDPYTSGNNNWNHYQRLQQAHLHRNQPGREEQLPLPSYRSSHETSTNINHTASTRASLSSVLGKRPAASNHSQSFFQQPTTQQPLHGPDMSHECKLETDELFSLVQSVGTPAYVWSWEKLFRSGSSSMYGPRHTSSAHATAGCSGTASDKGKGKEMHSYSELPATVEKREFVKKQRKERIRYLSKLTVGLDAYYRGIDEQHK